jgi:transposase
MAKHSQEFKRQVVEHYLSENVGYKSVSQLFGIDHSTVRKWIAAFNQHGSDGLFIKTTKTVYPPDFKLDVVHAIIEEGLSLWEAQQRFCVRERMTIRQWLRLYESGGIAALQPKPKGHAKPMPKLKQPQSNSVTADQDKTHAELLKELQYLRAENAFLKKLDALIQAQKAEQQSPQD